MVREGEMTEPMPWTTGDYSFEPKLTEFGPEAWAEWGTRDKRDQYWAISDLLTLAILGGINRGWDQEPTIRSTRWTDDSFEVQWANDTLEAPAWQVPIGGDYTERGGTLGIATRLLVETSEVREG